MFIQVGLIFPRDLPRIHDTISPALKIARRTHIHTQTHTHITIINASIRWNEDWY